MNASRRFSVRDLTLIGMLAALLAIATTIRIPYGQGAMVHLGRAALFTTAILFGGVYAGLAAAIGSALFDIVMGFSPYTLWSFFIQGIAGLITGTIAHSGGAYGKNFVRNVLACLAGAAWVLAGYLVAWTAVIGKVEAAILNAPSSLMTSAAGFVVAMPLATTLGISLRKAGFIKAKERQN